MNNFKSYTNCIRKFYFVFSIPPPEKVKRVSRHIQSSRITKAYNFRQAAPVFFTNSAVPAIIFLNFYTNFSKSMIYLN